jgi:hypothetical protein
MGANERILGMEKFWSAVEHHWNSNRAVAWILVLCGTGLALRAMCIPQSPGISIGLLALVAGIMSVRPNMHPAEKFAWVFILIAFTILEVLAIGRADQTSERTRQAQILEFGKIASSLQTAISQGQVQYNSTITHVDTVLTKTQQAADTATEAVNTITGGDSFLVFYMVTEDRGGIAVNGKHAIHAAHVRIADAFDAQETLRSLMTTQPPIEVVVNRILNAYSDAPISGDLPTGFIQTFPMPLVKVHGDEVRYIVQFSALNGLSSEIYIRKRLRPGVWVQAYKVISGSKPHMGAVLRQEVDPNFPRDANGKVQWDLPGATGLLIKPPK